MKLFSALLLASSASLVPFLARIPHQLPTQHTPSPSWHTSWQAFGAARCSTGRRGPASAPFGTNSCATTNLGRTGPEAGEGSGLAAQEPEAPRDWRELAIEGGPTLRYLLHTPPGFQAEETCPFVVAFPPGDQSEGMATWIVDYFAAEADRHGWVLVAPVAVGGESWVSGLEEHFPALFASLEEEFAIEYGGVHVVGVSNGGRSAFRVVGLYPELAHSFAALPGMPSSDEDWERLQNIAHLPIAMYVGETDTAWVEGARRAQSALGGMGAPDVSLTVVPGGGHVLGEDVARSVFDGLRRSRDRKEREENAHDGVAAVLDSLHDAAAKADEVRYFGHFAPAATFIGTDAKERWSLIEFKAYALPYFEGETAWTYVPFERHIAFSADLRTAWFDEKLRNEKYGETRGSGVLVEGGGKWRLAHYVLSFAIPNEAAGDVVERVREERAK